MRRCIARRKDLERCGNDAERGSLFCRRHRWWWLVTLFGSVVVLTTLGANIATMFGVTFGELWVSPTPTITLAPRTEPATLAPEAPSTVLLQVGTWSIDYFSNIYLNPPAVYHVDQAAEPNSEGGYSVEINSYDLRVNPQIPQSNLSIRLSGLFAFEDGYYEFHCEHHDGCRVYVDGQIWVDAWWDGGGGHDLARDIPAGDHLVSIEFYDKSGLGLLNVIWKLKAPITPTETESFMPSEATSSTLASQITQTPIAMLTTPPTLEEFPQIFIEDVQPSTGSEAPPNDSACLWTEVNGEGASIVLTLERESTIHKLRVSLFTPYVQRARLTFSDNSQQTVTFERYGDYVFQEILLDPVKTTTITVEVLEVENESFNNYGICHIEVFGRVP